MAFEEVFGSNRSTSPYGGDEFARLVNQYEAGEFVYMIQNVECDITRHYVETCNLLFIVPSKYQRTINSRFRRYLQQLMM